MIFALWLNSEEEQFSHNSTWFIILLKAHCSQKQQPEVFPTLFCGLLWLNPGAWGEHLTSGLSWEAAWLLVTCVSPVYLIVDEFSLCVLWPLDWVNCWLRWRFHMVSMVLLIGSWWYCREWVWNLGAKLYVVLP